MRLPVFLELEQGSARRPQLVGERAGARLLERWPQQGSGRPPETMVADDGLWLVDAELGEIRISKRPGRLAGWPAPGVTAEDFSRQVILDWLPAIYPVWGWQVLHASAVVEEASGRVVAFSGESGAGKSTFGFTLGRRAGWSQFADDALPFECHGGAVSLREVPNEVRLRSPSAEHFGERPYSRQALEWPGQELELAGIFFLEPVEGPGGVGGIRRMRGSEACPRLMEQAFALSLEDSEVRAGLMEDYLQLAASVPVWLVQYSPDLAAIDGYLDEILGRTMSTLGAQ